MKKHLFVLSMLVFAASVFAGPTFVLGPDMVSDQDGPAPYVFTGSDGGYSYKLTIDENLTPSWRWHVPVFTLENTSTNGAKILSFEFTIGDVRYNFDHLGVVPRDMLGSFMVDTYSDGSYASWTPDNVDGEVRSDYILYAEFEGFDSGDVFTFLADVDVDGVGHPGSVEDFRSVFWNNGLADNSEITVTFTAVPVPGAMILAGAGLGGIGWLRRKRLM